MNNKIETFINSPLYQRLLADGASCFFSVRGGKGKLKQRVLEELPIDEFFSDLIRVDDEVEGITGEDFIQFTVSVESMLKHFTDNIVDLVSNAQNEVFNRYVEYDEGGIFRDFAANYNRIQSGRNPGIHNILSGIHRLYAHYFKEFQKTPAFKKDEYLTRFYSKESGRRAYPIDLIAEHFAMLINLLCMNMMCEYYGDKEEFSSETLLQNSINAIRSHLVTLFNTPTHSVEPIQDRGWREEPLVDLYMVNLAFNQPAKLEDFELIIGEEISRNKLINYMKRSMEKPSLTSNSYYFNFHLDERNLYYFDTLMDLMSKLNHFEAMYLKLKELSKINSPGDENYASTLFHLYLKKPDQSTELTTV